MQYDLSVLCLQSYAAEKNRCRQNPVNSSDPPLVPVTTNPSYAPGIPQPEVHIYDQAHVNPERSHTVRRSHSTPERQVYRNVDSEYEPTARDMTTTVHATGVHIVTHGNEHFPSTRLGEQAEGSEDHTPCLEADIAHEHDIGHCDDTIHDEDIAIDCYEDADHAEDSHDVGIDHAEDSCDDDVGHDTDDINTSQDRWPNTCESESSSHGYI